MFGGYNARGFFYALLKVLSLVVEIHLKAPQVVSSNSSVSEAEDLEDLTTTDEPLFWPFERKTDRNSEETWNYFSMSPRKGMSSKIMKLKQKYKETENGKFHVSEPVGVVNDRIEEDFASKEVPIEMFLGLTEFDGHEGVDSEFNEDDFSLHVSLC
ncbi:hypothetical protein EV1_031530 [Malus domestica]